MKAPGRPLARPSIGIGFRPELAAALLSDAAAVDFVEVVAEACRDRRVRREAVALSNMWPVVPHGVKLSLGSAEGIDEARAIELGKLARELRAPLVSEHVSFVRGGGREIGHLTELPMSRAAVRVVACNVERLRRHLPDVPLLLENVARGFVWDEREHEMSEGDFYGAIVRATGCDLLLDVGNLYANAVNAGLDPVEHLATFPLAHVAMLHVAGGIVEDGFYFDTHAHPVPEAVFDLVTRALDASPRASLLLERDASFEKSDDILGEIVRLRAIASKAAPSDESAPVSAPTPNAFVPALDAQLAAAQEVLARQLTSAAPAGHVAIDRARAILEKKRADDALPLLPELGRRICPAQALALGDFAHAPRLPSMTAVADARRIARAAQTRPELADAAARDELVLRARFTGGEGVPVPRTWPFVGRVRQSDRSGRALWALKGFGRGADVRVYGGG